MTFPFAAFVPGNSMPLPFAFTNAANVPKNALVTSGTITPTGYDSIAEVSVTNGAQVSVAGRAWTSLVTYIVPGETIAVRMTSANAWASQVSTTVTIGGRSTTWFVTTGTASSGVWDTGWTTGSWNLSTPAFFNYFRVQLWAPGGGGGGGGGTAAYGGSGGVGGAGGAAGYCQFAGGPYATGGAPGTGGGPGFQAFPGAGSDITGYNGGGGGHGTGVGGDTNVYAGGAAGGGGGIGAWQGYPSRAGNGGPGGYGGYMLKTYLWGQIAASTLYSVVLQGPGGGGAGGVAGPNGAAGAAGASGGYGRAFVDWG